MAAEDPTVVSLLAGQIASLGDSLNRRLDEQNKTQAEFKKDTHELLNRIDAKVDTTSNRVTSLEKARERAQGVMLAFSWIPAAFTSIVTAGLTILTMVLTGSIK